MGKVYLAWHTFMKREVAIKVLRPELALNPRLTERFRREAEAASRVENDFVIKMYDFGQTADGLFYAAMERVHGETLRERLDDGALSFDDGLRVAVQMTDAIAAAHRGGVVHRDLKPDNVMLCTEKGDQVKVLDFGIAKLVEVDQSVDAKLTKTGMIMGTPHYMSPEAATGEKVGPPADVYALGITIFEMLTGTLLFDGANTLEVLTRHMSEPPARVSARARQPIPSAMDELVLSMLRKTSTARPSAADVLTSLRAIMADPGPMAVRYETGEDFMHEIDTVVESSRFRASPETDPSASTATTTVDVVPSPPSPSSSRKWITAAIMLMVLSAIAALMFMTNATDTSSDTVLNEPAPIGGEQEVALEPASAEPAEANGANDLAAPSRAERPQAEPSEEASAEEGDAPTAAMRRSKRTARVRRSAAATVSEDAPVSEAATMSVTMSEAATMSATMSEAVTMSATMSERAFGSIVEWR